MLGLKKDPNKALGGLKPRLKLLVRFLFAVVSDSMVFDVRVDAHHLDRFYSGELYAFSLGSRGWRVWDCRSWAKSLAYD